MKVLGIDPASGMTGVALLDGVDLIDTWVWEKTKGKSGPWNIRDYYNWIKLILVSTKPDMACVEFLSVHRNAQTTRKVSHFQAVSVLACKIQEIMVIEGHVKSARKEALGDGQGSLSKDEVWPLVKKMYPDYQFRRKDCGGEDEADAIVLALAGPGLAERS